MSQAPAPPESFAKETLPVSLEEEMKRSYLDYAMSVIVGRALPDARDGLKPVHRRVLFVMQSLNNVWNRPYVKCANVVGEVMGKYHPHGDTAIYDTLVRMAQDFSLRYTLVDGQGNFGSVDGDNPAAMRYTECRLDKIATEVMADLDRETVDFIPNYDGTRLEPTVLPTRIPNLLVNGQTGIAVGMATNIPPHNLREVIAGTLALLRQPDMSIDELMVHIPAPDFPTAGIIYGIAGVREGYRTGRGRVIMRARTHLENVSKDKQAIIVDELPYQVNKKTLIEKIADLVRSKEIDGIADMRDESDRKGMRIYIELKRNEFPEVVLNQLFKQTELQSSFGINMVALVDGQPRLLNIRQILDAFLRHRREVVSRRTAFDLKKSRERAHVLEGLAVALSNVDAVIALIKAAATPPEAKLALMAQVWPSQLVADMLSRVAERMARLVEEEDVPKDWGMSEAGYRLSEIQAQAILDMRLQRLTGLEQNKLSDEYREVMDHILDLLDILSNPARVTRIIEEELQAVSNAFGDARRSEIVSHGEDIALEDLISPEDRVVTLSHSGYMKAQAIVEYRAQRRGGRGRLAASTKDDDFIDNLFVANTHDYVLCFTSLGRVYWLKVYEIPEGGHGTRGRPIVNLLQLQENEKVTTVLPVKTFDDDHFVFMATRQGTVKKTPLSDFSRPMKRGIIAINLDEGDQLVGVAITSGKHQVMLCSSAGKAVRFDEADVRPLGRSARGVRGMTLGEDHTVISLLAADSEDWQVLTASDGGYGKRTPIADFRHTSRGTQGVIAMDLTEKTGRTLVAASLVQPTDGLMLITTGGVLIRTQVDQIRETGRSAQGVRLISLAANERLSGIEKILESEDEETHASNESTCSGDDEAGAGSDDGLTEE